MPDPTPPVSPPQDLSASDHRRRVLAALARFSAKPPEPERPRRPWYRDPEGRR